MRESPVDPASRIPAGILPRVWGVQTGGGSVNCQACGHPWHAHGWTRNPLDTELDPDLCETCYIQLDGGPCFPWEFR